MRVASRSASAPSWVTYRIGSRSVSRSRSIATITSSRRPRSSEASGSSISRNLAPDNSARPIATRFASPPDSVAGQRSSRCSSPSSATIVTPPTRTCPAAGRNNPATMLSTLDLPTPDGPNSTVSPLSCPSSGTTAPTTASPSRTVTSMSKDMPTPAAAPRQRFGQDQRDQRQRHRHAGKPHDAGLATRHLQRAVDRDRQRCRLARHVGDEGDRRPELAERTREAQHHAGQHAGQAERRGHRPKDTRTPRTQRPRDAFQPPVDTRRSTNGIARTNQRQRHHRRCDRPRPDQRNSTLTPNQAWSQPPIGPFGAKASSKSHPVTTGGSTNGK
ncbi:unnamed protein product [Sordaria macrospora k-hell]|uniref:WGS project CABT00000000 data, contig 2.283 n=1 Tax=Sordaria macrospora (strain ATCC MYA-333 / DSM 997 / K(L3346) / K-hell) TaxID=771870 RepID=F7WCU7_SORMK|nr:unnamed protein product [Sordaria macrospora k-hell]